MPIAAKSCRASASASGVDQRPPQIAVADSRTNEEVFGIARTTGIPGGRWRSIVAVETPAATVISSCRADERAPRTASSAAATSNGLTARTTIPAAPMSASLS